MFDTQVFYILFVCFVVFLVIQDFIYFYCSCDSSLLTKSEWSFAKKGKNN